MIDPALTDDRTPPSPDEGAVRLPTYAARARRLREDPGAPSVQYASGEVVVAPGRPD